MPCSNCEETLARAREAEQAWQQAVADLGVALKTLARLEFVSGVCPACLRHQPDHESGCWLHAFLEQSSARHVRYPSEAA